MTAVHATAPNRVPTSTKQEGMDWVRKAALVAGILYLITFASSIPAAFVFIDPVLANADVMSAAGADTALLRGGFLDLINALACIGTAVVLFPLLRREHEGAALGFVTTRIFEAAIIVIGIISLLSVVTLRQSMAGAAGTDAASLATTGNALVAIRDWTFLLGPVFMAALNALLLGFLMHRSRLVPRLIPTMGLIGGPLLLASGIAAFFGFHDLTSPTHIIAVAPIFFWELSLGIYMAFKGFRPTAVARLDATPVVVIPEPVAV